MFLNIEVDWFFFLSAGSLMVQIFGSIPDVSRGDNYQMNS